MSTDVSEVLRLSGGEHKYTNTIIYVYTHNAYFRE